MYSFSMLILNMLAKPVPFERVLGSVLMLIFVTSITACGSKEKTGGQTLVRVNGKEITILQINDELKRAAIQANQQEAATRQLLESLIDQQLIIEEAMRNKIHRSPEVIQEIERAKAQIIEQAYLKSIVSRSAAPSASEIKDYYLQHPEFFAERKQFDMQQLIIPTSAINEELKSIMASADSLDKIVSWLNRHNVRYARGQLSRSASDLPEQIMSKINKLHKGQLFVVKEGKNSLLNFIVNIKSSPVTINDAAPQIEQHLSNKKSLEVVEAETAHLRSLAKIDYSPTLAPVTK